MHRGCRSGWGGREDRMLIDKLQNGRQGSIYADCTKHHNTQAAKPDFKGTALSLPCYL